MYYILSSVSLIIEVKIPNMENFKPDSAFPIVDVEVKEGKTAPPEYLSESELISLVVF